MNTGEILGRLKIIQNRLKSRQPEKLRPFFRALNPDDRGVLLVGARGVGKTTFMLSCLDKGHYFYFSADNPLAAMVHLYDLIEAIFMEGYEAVFIDEVHYASEWSKHLKAAYDSFPDRIFWASDSSSIVLREGLADISRRFRVIQIPLLSLREYLLLSENIELPCIDPYHYNEKDVFLVSRKVNVLRFFKEYLAHGFRPIFLEGIDTYLEKVMNTLVKAMQADIPFLVPRISENHLRLMNAVVGYIAVSSVPTVSVNTLCDEWNLSKEKLYQLLYAMERAHIIRIIRRKNDTRLHSVGAKILLYEPSIYAHFSNDPGNMRESFVAGSAIEAGRKVYASKNETEYDFLIDEMKVEVGGRKKQLKSADFVIRDNLDLPEGNTIPLWLLGMEY